MIDVMEIDIDRPQKVVYVVGLGPGEPFYMTQQATNTLESVDAICGYKVYLDLIRDEFPCRSLTAVAGRWKRHAPASGWRWSAPATPGCTAWQAPCWSLPRTTRTLPWKSCPG